MLCFCPPYNMVLLFGVKHMHLMLIQSSNYRKKQSELSHFQGESECLFPEDLRSRERTYLVFGAHFGAERGYKTMGIQCPIVSNNRYQLFFGAHWRTKLLCPKMFGAEKQRDSPWSHFSLICLPLFQSSMILSS